MYVEVNIKIPEHLNAPLVLIEVHVVLSFVFHYFMLLSCLLDFVLPLNLFMYILIDV